MKSAYGKWATCAEAREASQRLLRPGEPPLRQFYASADVPELS